MTPPREGAAREELLARAVAWFAEHGVGDTSLRTLATGIGTSHRMLNYHFGSRSGLLGAVVEAVERSEQEALLALAAETDDPFEAGALFWTRVADRAAVFAPLFFELSTHAMRGEPHAAPLRRWLGEGWLPALADLFRFAPPPAGWLGVSALTAVVMLLGLQITRDRAPGP